MSRDYWKTFNDRLPNEQEYDLPLRELPHDDSAMPEPCDKCGRSVGCVIRYIQRSGRTALRWCCANCGRIQLRSLPHTGMDLTAYPIKRDLRGANPPCTVCGVPGTEQHHWAPSAVFGWEEANRWPTSFLCPDHHIRWHQMMVGRDRVVQP